MLFRSNHRSRLNWEHDYDKAVSEDWRRTSAIARAREASLRLPYLIAIAQAVIDLPHKDEDDQHQAFVGDNGHLLVDGQDMGHYLAFETTYSAGYGMLRRGSKPIGSRIVAGAYGERTSYPMKKDGTYSYTKIAERLVAEAAHRNRRDQANTNQAHNKAAAERVKASHGLREYDYTVQPSGSGSLPVALDIKIAGCFTEKRAEEILLALRRLGITPSRH